MKLKIYQVDAFTDKVFSGNPAAVIPLEKWLPDETLQAIALENNLSETAYFVKIENGYHLRWFTPVHEIELCGHATLASAFILFNKLDYNQDIIRFDTLSGDLLVRRDGKLLSMDFPLTYMQPKPYSSAIEEALQSPYQALYESETKLMVVFETEQQVQKLQPNFYALKAIGKNLIATAKGENCDFISRFFAPVSGIDEDPVTGSAHTALTPYWAAKLNKKVLSARQISSRGGDLRCEMADERAIIKGQAVLYMEGQILL